jgi:hypothetical protein
VKSFQAVREIKLKHQYFRFLFLAAMPDVDHSSSPKQKPTAVMAVGDG